MFLAILNHYLIWHYSRAYFEFFRIWMNLLWFVVHYFSITQLLKSWFSPWKRMTEERTKAWDIEDMFGTIVINLLSRIIGAIMRTVMILVGTISLLFTFFGGIVVYLVWIIAPVLIVALMILGIVYII